MRDFDYLAGFFGVLFGLIIAQIATRLAEAIDEHHRRPIGLLTSLLAAFVLFDATGFWLYLWSARETITVSWPSVFVSTAFGIIYYLATALIFPRVPTGWASYDEHYWARKRIVIAGVLAVNAAVQIGQISRRIPDLRDFWFFFYQLGYFIPVTTLVFTKRRWLDIVLLSWLLVYFLISGLNLLPPSEWGNALLLNP